MVFETLCENFRADIVAAALRCRGVDAGLVERFRKQVEGERDRYLRKEEVAADARACAAIRAMADKEIERAKLVGKVLIPEFKD